MRRMLRIWFLGAVFGVLIGQPAFATELPPFAKDATAVTPLLIGSEVPAVDVYDTDGNRLAFSQALQGKPSVVIFYRGSWCPYCSRHLAAMQDIEEKLVAMGLQIVAISPDRPERLTASEGTEHLKYRLYSDSDMKLARAFGIAFKLDEPTLERLKSYKIDVAQASGRDHGALPVPSVFIVDSEGKIHFTYVNPDYRVRLDGDVILAAAAGVVADQGS